MVNPSALSWFLARGGLLDTGELHKAMSWLGFAIMPEVLGGSEGTRGHSDPHVSSPQWAKRAYDSGSGYGRYNNSQLADKPIIWGGYRFAYNLPL